MPFTVMEDHEVVIVGGGIGGLATAVALKRVGVKAVVLEKAAELRAGGGAIIVSSNGCLALDALGVADKLPSLNIPIERVFVTDVKTKSTQQVPFADYRRLIPVQRRTLVQVLADELPPDSIRFSSKLTSIESVQLEDGNHISVLALENGNIIKAKVVIGCDGVHSVVAKRLKLSPPIDAGRFGVQGLSVYPEGHGLPHFVQQFVDVSERAGFVPLTDSVVYWYISCKTPPEGEDSRRDLESIQRDVIKKWAKDFPSSFLDVVRQSDLSTLWMAPLMYRNPWSVLLGTLNKENITVVGDAMHPTTPDLGQGGCMALEDAVVLGRHIGNSVSPDGKLRDADIGQALRKYVGERRWRATWVIAASTLSGWIQQDGSVWWTKFLRNMFYIMLLPIVTNIIHYDCGKLPNKM